MAAANTDKFKKGARRFTTAIAAGGVADGSVTTIPLDSTAGLPTDTAVEITIDRTDASGTFTPTFEEVVTGVVSGSNLVTCTRGVEGTAQAHSAGATVEVRLTSNQWDDLIDGLLAEHNQDGTHTEDVLEVVYPVGSVYINATVATNPGTLLGIGTWVAWSVGRAIVGIDPSDADFDTAEETSGAKTHTLTQAQLPAATISINPPSTATSTASLTGTLTSHGIGTGTTWNGASGVFAGGTTQSNKYHSTDTATGANSYGTISIDASHSHTVDIAAFNSGNLGSGDAHPIVQPSQVGYVWKRTA